jgi:hypothetical protein
MGVGRIVNPSTPAIPSTAEASAAESVPATLEQAPFAAAISRAEPAQATATSAPTRAESVGPLDQLRSGAITLDQYVDLKVQEAIRPIGPSSAAHVESIREALRERLSTDPTLVQLLRTAGSGAAPGRSSED